MSSNDSIYIPHKVLSKQNEMPLELFRMMSNYHPYHFWQLANSSVPVNSACNTALNEYSYQNADRIGRDEMRDAIATAEQMMRPYLNYFPYPHYVEEIVEFPHYIEHNPFFMTLAAREGKIISTGVRTLDSIGSDIELTFSCEYNNNGLLDTFTATVTPSSLYSEDEIMISVGEDYYIRRYENTCDYKIDPVDIDVNTTTYEITITGSIWLLVKPALYEGFSQNEIDPSNTDNFVDKIDIWHEYPSSGASYNSAEAILIWDNRPKGWNSCFLSGLEEGVTYAYGRLGIRDAEQGLFSIGEAFWDDTNEVWTSYNGWLSAYEMPDRAIIRYKAGAQATTEYISMICRLAAAELERPICACDGANRWFGQWQKDLSKSSIEQFTNLPQNALANPFGTRKGHVDTWLKIQAKQNLRGFAI